MGLQLVTGLSLFSIHKSQDFNLRHKHHKNRVRPNARQVVITAGSPSGIAATAKATAILSSNGRWGSDPFDPAGGMSLFYDGWEKRIWLDS